MTLVKTQPRLFEQTFNNLVSDLFFPPASLYRNGATNRTVGQQVPVNILKTESGFALQLVAPGLEKDAFKIHLDRGLLTISVAEQPAAGAEQQVFVRREFQQQAFSRSWTLDETIDATGIEAQYQNGILHVTLPRKAAVKEPVKQITVQ